MNSLNTDVALCRNFFSENQTQYYIRRQFTNFEFGKYRRALDALANVIDHREERLPNYVALLVLEEQGHVEGDLEAELVGVSEIPGVVEQFGAGESRYRLEARALQIVREQLPIVRVVVHRERTWAFEH